MKIQNTLKVLRFSTNNQEKNIHVLTQHDRELNEVDSSKLGDLFHSGRIS